MKAWRWEALLTRTLRVATDSLALTLTGSASRPQSLSVHDARKTIKKLRAAFRLLREAFPADRVQEINRGLRGAGRAVSPLRDREVLRKIEMKLKRMDEMVVAPSSWSTSSQRSIVRALRQLEKVGGRLKDLPWENIDRSLVRRGLKRLYRRARRAMREAKEEPSNDRLHTWRKRTKDFGYALRLVGRDESSVEKRTFRLAEHLGDDHDLALFLEKSPRRRQANTLDRQARRDRRHHQQKAFRLGHRLFSQRPSAFIRDLV
jgi:CHAD domain-containing protein